MQRPMSDERRSSKAGSSKAGTSRAGSSRRRVAAVSAVVLSCLAGSGAAAIGSGPCWPPPVVAHVVDRYREPACRWCAGNRGIEYRTAPGTGVRSVAAGRVTFSGVVAGRQYVVVDVGAGRRVTYGGLVERVVRTGDVVVQGQVVGVSGDSLHLGVRVADRYVDPGPIIGRVEGRVRLVPSNGRPGATSTRVVRCEGASGDSAR